MGQVFLPPRSGTNKLTLEGYDHLTWRHKLIPYIRTDNCIDMSNMFSGENYSLPETLDLRNFNTMHVTTMHGMFDGCMSETILGLTNFNTELVTDMSFMFNNSKATELDLSSFDTSSVVTMENMFANSLVEDLDISSLDTSSVTDMSSLFENVAAPLDVSNFDTRNVEDMCCMFKGTSGTDLDLTHFNTSNVTDMGGMFEDADYETIDISSFDTSSVTNMRKMFKNTTVEDIDISNFDFSNVENMEEMFYGLTLDSLDLPNSIDVSNVLNINEMFRNVTINSLDLSGFDFSSIETKNALFDSLHANTLDISTWDLGAGIGVQAGYGESLFNRANINNIIFSNSNTFPDGYEARYMFGHFICNGTLDLSSFHFTNINTSVNDTSMFYDAHINTLILPDMINEDTYIRPFHQTSVELLDMSGKTLQCYNSNSFFDGLTATRINMPNKICVENGSDSATSTGKAKYVDYSSVDTTNVSYTDNQWQFLSEYTVRYSKISWIPSTFVLDGNRTMSTYLSGDVYTDALNYAELGWNREPEGVVMHYGQTHADFEQAILDDDSDEWVSPSGTAIFFCHTHVPLGSALTINQFDSNYNTIYLDNEPVEEGYVFDEVGDHYLKINVYGYDYKQKVTVVDHGNSYSIVGTVYKNFWDATNRYYNYNVTNDVECRLYSDKYLFIYPLARIKNDISEYITINSNPSYQATKVSGMPFQIRQLSLNSSSMLTDISELIICSSPFNPDSMFYNCTNLSDVSVVNKWNVSTNYSYREYQNGYIQTRYSNYNYYRTFSKTRINRVPRISITSGSSDTFKECTYLNDISELNLNFSSSSNDSIIYFSRLFSDCSNLVNVSRLKDNFHKFMVMPNNTGEWTRKYLSLNGMLMNTGVRNADFIPDEGLNVVNIDNLFENCASLTNIDGMSRLIWRTNYYSDNISLYGAFSGTPITDFSPIANWDVQFVSVQLYSCNMTSLSFMSNWDLSRCNNFSFASCTRLTDISALNNKERTDDWIYISLYNCSSLTSLNGLSGFKLSSVNLTNCSSLTSLNGLQNCTITLSSGMCSGCTSLRDISALSSATFDSSTNNISSMFNGCSSLVSLDGLENLDISNITDLNAVFYGCTALSDIDAISGWNPYQVTNVAWLFTNCSSITSFAPLRNWTTAQLTAINGAFTGCSSITDLTGLTGFNIGQSTTMSGLFKGCTSLTDITAITIWYVANVYNMSEMFYGCTALTSVAPLRNWRISGLGNMERMFYNCTSISDADTLETWKNVKSMTSVSRTNAFYNVPRPIPTWAIN